MYPKDWTRDEEDGGGGGRELAMPLVRRRRRRGLLDAVRCELCLYPTRSKVAESGWSYASTPPCRCRCCPGPSLNAEGAGRSGERGRGVAATPNNFRCPNGSLRKVSNFWWHPCSELGDERSVGTSSAGHSYPSAPPPTPPELTAVLGFSIWLASSVKRSSSSPSLPVPEVSCRPFSFAP